MTILTVNTGSSSVRLAVFAPEGESLSRRASGHFSGDRNDLAAILRIFLSDHGIEQVATVAHRVVHGSARLTAPCRIDASVEAEIESLAPLAPLHNPRALEWIRACRAVLGADVVQVAVFDSGFYARLPEVARHYALPPRLGLRRYGFHGIAHQAMWQRWCEHQPGSADRGRVRGCVISLQLGAGCSITAIADGVPQDTSMGFSPLEGLVMATRAGDLDPGALLYLLREKGMTADALDHLLSKESGLLGVSGTSADMRELLASTEPGARLAVDLYCYRARKYLGAYLAVLGGADAILFGGGVGEHAAPVRAQILAGMEWAGIRFDAEVNSVADEGARRISTPDSRIEAWVIPVDEATILAEAAVSVLADTSTMLPVERRKT